MDVSLSVPDGLSVEETIAGARLAIAEERKNGGRVGLVPTMGALHAGHTSLIEAARQRCDFVAVSIFVNPTQFGPNEDFSRYPRTIDADLAACRDAGASLVFLPSDKEVYPAGCSTSVEVAGLSEILEGAIRPGHFRGVATIVLKLLNIIKPDVAFFGQKDYQQQLILRRMVTDLDVPVEIDTRPTIREADGLAMSSRNRYLDSDQRQRARALSQALFSTRERLQSGERDLPSLRQDMRDILEAGGLAVDYAAIADRQTLAELATTQREMVLLVAARLGDVRLIDNCEVTLAD